MVDKPETSSIDHEALGGPADARPRSRLGTTMLENEKAQALARVEGLQAEVNRLHALQEELARCLVVARGERDRSYKAWKYLDPVIGRLKMMAMFTDDILPGTERAGIHDLFTSCAREIEAARAIGLNLNVSETTNAAQSHS